MTCVTEEITADVDDIFFFLTGRRADEEPPYRFAPELLPGFDLAPARQWSAEVSTWERGRCHGAPALPFETQLRDAEGLLWRRLYFGETPEDGCRTADANRIAAVWDARRLTTEALGCWPEVARG